MPVEGAFAPTAGRLMFLAAAFHRDDLVAGRRPACWGMLARMAATFMDSSHSCVGTLPGFDGSRRVWVWGVGSAPAGRFAVELPEPTAPGHGLAPHPSTCTHTSVAPPQKSLTLIHTTTRARIGRLGRSGPTVTITGTRTSTPTSETHRGDRSRRPSAAGGQLAGRLMRLDTADAPAAPHDGGPGLHANGSGVNRISRAAVRVLKRGNRPRRRAIPNATFDQFSKARAPTSGPQTRHHHPPTASAGRRSAVA